MRRISAVKFQSKGMQRGKREEKEESENGGYCEQLRTEKDKEERENERESGVASESEVWVEMRREQRGEGESKRITKRRERRGLVGLSSFFPLSLISPFNARYTTSPLFVSLF